MSFKKVCAIIILGKFTNNTGHLPLGQEEGNNMEPEKNMAHSWRNPKIILILIGMLLITGIVVVSILRDRIVNQNQWQVSVMGQGKVSYQPDIAIVNLGVQVERVSTAESALSQLNKKMASVLKAIEELGIAAEDIQTQNFTVFSQYDYIDQVSVLAGYNANQQLSVKVKELDKNPDLVSNIIIKASAAGANQVNGVSFNVSNLESLKDQARIKALEDARRKAASLASAAGVKLKKVVGWWENLVQAPGIATPYSYDGKGGAGGGTTSGTIPTGQQEIIIEIGLNYQVK